MIIPTALARYRRSATVLARYPQKLAKILFAGKNFVKILVTAQTQVRSYSEQQRAFGNSNIFNSGNLCLAEEAEYCQACRGSFGSYCGKGSQLHLRVPLQLLIITVSNFITIIVTLRLLKFVILSLTLIFIALLVHLKATFVHLSLETSFLCFKITYRVCRPM